MSKETLENNIDELLSIIEVCINNKIILPSLILLYSGIDIMSWINRSNTHEDVNKDDFTKWVTEFMLIESKLPCNALDLYSARCALLHSYSSESRLSREGKAKRIYYAWGKADFIKLQNKIDEKSHPAIALHVNDLFRAFKNGVEKYFKLISSDSAKSTIISQRITKFFINIPDYYIK